MGLIIFLMALPFIYVLMKLTEKDEEVPSYLGFPEVTPYYETTQPEGHRIMVRDLIPNYAANPIKALTFQRDLKRNFHRSMMELHANYLKDKTPGINIRRSTQVGSFTYDVNAVLTQVFVSRIYDEYSVVIMCVCDQQRSVVAEWNITKLRLDDIAKMELTEDILMKVEIWNDYKSKDPCQGGAITTPVEPDVLPADKFGPYDHEDVDLMKEEDFEAWGVEVDEMLAGISEGSVSTNMMGIYPEVDDSNLDTITELVIENIFFLPEHYYSVNLSLVAQVTYKGILNLVYRSVVNDIDYLLVIKHNPDHRPVVEAFRVYGPLPTGTRETLPSYLRTVITTVPQFNYL